jgi:hypothetical protein
MKFFLVFTKNRKKFDKYSKTNKIRNKTIIDIAKIAWEEDIDLNDPSDMKYFKVIIYKLILLSKEKNKTIYYIPWIKSDLNIEKLLDLKKLDVITDFNLLLFFNDFTEDYWINTITNNFDVFTNIQILEDY